MAVEADIAVTVAKVVALDRRMESAAVDVRHAVDAAANRLGGVDIVIAYVGIAPGWGEGPGAEPDIPRHRGRQPPRHLDHRHSGSTADEPNWAAGGHGPRGLLSRQARGAPDRDPAAHRRKLHRQVTASAGRTTVQTGTLLEGRRAVVTGGAHAIGRAIAQAFAAQGADVLCLDLDPAPVESPDGRRTIEVRELDVTDPEAADVVRAAEPDVLVNNVGHFLRPARYFHSEEPADWAEVLKVNLDHVLALTAAALPGIIERRRGGSVITLTTVEAFRGIPGQSVYSGAKAALEGWSRSMAVEHGADRIRFNTIAPDLIDSRQVPYDQLVAEEDRWRWRMWAPLGRPGSPADVAGPAVFLASDMSAYVTGTTVHVDGGSLAASGWFPRTQGQGWTNRPFAP